MSRKIRGRQRIVVKTRQKFRQYVIATSAVVTVLSIAFVIFFQSAPKDVRASVTGEYRSRQSGFWNVATNWERFNGTAWVTASTSPTSTDNIITIQDNHVITVSAAVTADQIVINANGTLSVNSGINLTIANGAGSDLQCAGTFDLYGGLVLSTNADEAISGTFVHRSTGIISRGTGATISVTGTYRWQGGTIPSSPSWITIQSGGTFDHNVNGNGVPVLTWNSNSNILFSGITTTAPWNLYQSFGNIIWNCPSMNTDLNFAGGFSAARSFTMISTGTAKFYFDQQGNNSVLSLTGDFNIQGGTTFICLNGSATINVSGNVNMTGGNLNFNEAGATAYGNSSGTMNVTGNINLSGGTMDVSQSTSSNPAKGVGIINLIGNLNITGGILTATTTLGKGQIYFAGTAVQTVQNNNNIQGEVDYIVNPNAIVRLDQVVLTGSGDFTLMSAGGLMIGSNDGITLTGASGNVQSTGTRSYSTGADYTYNGIAYQTTGNGLPATVRNLTLNNSNHCNLLNTVTVSNTLTFTSGNWVATNDTLILGTSTSNLGTLVRTSGHVVGSFRRWVNNTTATNVLFPVGTMTNYNYASFNFTTAPTAGGSIVCNLIANGNVSTNGLPITETGDLCTNIGYAYWNLGSMNGFSGGAWNVTVSAAGFPGINIVSTLHLFRRASSSSAWTAHATHVTATGTIANPILYRNGMTLLGHYGISAGAFNPLPIELMFFKAIPEENEVKLEWATASEINNDFFTIERSSDGENYTGIGNLRGAGNSTTRLNYSWTDNSPLKGVSFYRLRQTDFDGQNTVSDPQRVRMENAKEEGGIEINYAAPNPFDDYVKVSYQVENAGQIVIDLIDTQGKVLRSEKENASPGPNQFEFTSVSDIPKGIYFIRLNNAKSVETIKVIHN